MAGVKGRSGTNKGKDKAFADAIRLAVNGDDPVTGKRKLRVIAEKVVDLAVAGESWAVQQIGDRLDGKPAQESTVTLQRSVAELTDEEIANRIAELRGANASDGDEHSPLDPSQLN